MSTSIEKAAAAIELLPEEVRESAVAYLIEQGEKLRSLRYEIDRGMEDVLAGRVTEWNFAEFLRRSAHLQR
jgi:hypothetical protein